MNARTNATTCSLLVDRRAKERERGLRLAEKGIIHLNVCQKSSPAVIQLFRRLMYQLQLRKIRLPRHVLTEASVPSIQENALISAPRQDPHLQGA